MKLPFLIHIWIKNGKKRKEEVKAFNNIKKCLEELAKQHIGLSKKKSKFFCINPCHPFFFLHVQTHQVYIIHSSGQKYCYLNYIHMIPRLKKKKKINLPDQFFLNKFIILWSNEPINKECFSDALQPSHFSNC